MPRATLELVLAGMLAASTLLGSCGKPPQLPPPPEPAMGYDVLEPGVQAAISSARESVLAKPNDAATWHLLAQVYHGNTLLEEASSCYKISVTLDPSRAEAWHGLGLALSEAGEPTLAIDAFNRALQSAPGYCPAAWRAGYLWLELGDLQQANTQFEAALAIDGNEAAARVGLARVALSSGRPDVASSILEALRLDASNSYLDFLLAQSYRRQGRVQEAASLLGGGVTDPPQFADPWNNAIFMHGASYEALVDQVDHYLGSGADREALRRARSALELHPDDIPLLNRVSVAQVNLGQRDQALRTLKRALRLDENSAPIHLNLSIQYHSMNDLPRARQHARRCVELNSSMPEAYLQAGRLHLLANEVFPAALAYDRAFALGEQDVQERLVYANTLTRVGRFRDSEAQYRIILQKQPSNGNALAGIIDVRMVSGNLQAAAAAAQEAMARAPEHAMVRKVISSLQQRLSGQEGTRP